MSKGRVKIIIGAAAAAAVLAAGCLLALTVQIIQEGQLDNRTVTALERPEYGAGSTSWEMEYTWENGEKDCGY